MLNVEALGHILGFGLQLWGVVSEWVLLWGLGFIRASLSVFRPEQFLDWLASKDMGGFGVVTLPRTSMEEAL